MSHRIGIIGAGRVAQEHARAILATGGEIAAVCDTDANRAQRFASEILSGVDADTAAAPLAVQSLDEFFAVDGLQCVVVAVPNVAHQTVAIAALNAGKDVLLEKPMALSTEECDEIIAARDASGRMLQMGFVCRYAPRVAAVQELLNSGALGTIYHVKATMIRRRGIPGLGRWFTTKALSGGGVLIDIGVHLIDLVMHLTGRTHATSVNAVCESRFGTPIDEYVYEDMWAGPPDPNGVFDVEDSVCGLIRYSDALSLDLNIAWAANIPEALYRDGILLMGERGGCFFDLWGETFILTHERDGRVLDEQPAHNNEDAWNRAWNAQHEAFQRSVVTGDPPEASAAAGRNVQAIVEAMYRSGSTGRDAAVTSAP